MTGHTFVIADPGADHQGSLERMLTLVDVAAAAGADAIKPQLYRADSLYSPEHPDLRGIAGRYELPLEWLPTIAEHAAKVGIEFMCSAFSIELYDVVDAFVRRHKIASLESGDDVLIDHVLGFEKPVIMSTGASTDAEVWRFGDWPAQMQLLQCTTAYPATLEDSDLAVIRSGVFAGFSDHTRSSIAGAVAVACGATIVEKHIRLGDKASQVQPDAPHSFDPIEFRMYVSQIREAELLLGSSTKRIRPSELPLVALRRQPGKRRGE